MSSQGPGREPPRMRRTDVPLWRQALTGIGLLTAGALLAIAVGVAMAAVVSWLF